MPELLLQKPIEAEKPRHEPVIIVGGGLSGLVLSRNLKKEGIGHIVLEAGRPDRPQAIHYLTSQATAETLGLTSLFDAEVAQRALITGYTRFDGQSEGLVALEALSPRNKGRDGFVTLSMQQLREAFDDPTHVKNGQNVCKMDQAEDGTWQVATTNGDSYSSELVIDATGSSSKILRMSGAVDTQTINQRQVRACFGGVFPYFGPEDQLLFIDRFPPQEGISAQEIAGWIMPLGNQHAEVVVGWEGPLQETQTWFQGKPKELLKSYINWFNERGIFIDPENRTEPIAGVFSEGLLDYRKLKRGSTVVAFGESAGLNHPLNGYLIREVDDHAQVMTAEIKKRLEGKKWHPYQRGIAKSPVKYGLERALGNRKTESAYAGDGRAVATHRLQELLVTALGEDGLWRAIDNGVPMKDLIKGLMRNPSYTDEVVKLGWDYVKVLFKEDNIYLRELWLKNFSPKRG